MSVSLILMLKLMKRLFLCKSFEVLIPITIPFILLFQFSSLFPLSPRHDPCFFLKNLVLLVLLFLIPKQIHLSLMLFTLKTPPIIIFVPLLTLEIRISVTIIILIIQTTITKIKIRDAIGTIPTTATLPPTLLPLRNLNPWHRLSGRPTPTHCLAF